MRNALAVVDGERGATARLAIATASITFLGLPPREVVIIRAIRFASPDVSIPLAITNPEIMIHSPLPPYVEKRESMNP
jgi:hypothetical protein